MHIPKLEIKGNTLDEAIADLKSKLESKLSSKSPEEGQIMVINGEKYRYAEGEWTILLDEAVVLGKVSVKSSGAWEVKNQWTDSYISSYRDFVSKRAGEYQKKNERYTCEDLAIDLLIDFASKHSLPVSFVNLSGVYHTSSEKFQSVEEFRSAVLTSTGAPDLLHNTIAISKEELQPGDIILHYSESKKRVNHTQVVVNTDSEIISIKQGNFDWGLIRNSANIDNSRRYIGSMIQDGLYLKKTGDYYRDGDKTQGLLNSKITYGREWNFDEFNSNQKLNEAYKKAKKYFENKKNKGD